MLIPQMGWHPQHAHGLLPAPASADWYCDVCRAARPSLRFKCSEGCNWDACGTCMSTDGHSGDWRGESKSQWCSLANDPDGPVCRHSGGIISHEHWACCGRQGEQDKGAGCFTPAAAAVAVTSTVIISFILEYLSCK